MSLDYPNAMIAITEGFLIMAILTTIDSADISRLDKITNIRERIVSELTESNLPKDVDDRKFLLEAMAGIERTIFSKAKIKNEENANANNANASSLIAKVLLETKRDMMTADGLSQVLDLPDEITPGVVVPGNTDIGVIVVPDLD